MAAKEPPKTTNPPPEIKVAEPAKPATTPEIEVKSLSATPPSATKEVQAPLEEQLPPTPAEDFEAFLRDPENGWARDIALKVVSDFTSPKAPTTRLGFSVGNKARPLAPEPPPQVAVEEKQVTVTPRKTTENVRIGGKYYQFIANKPLQVPPGIRDHLREKGII